ncbi:hypothetical protein RBB84_22090 [Rhodococcus sp. D-6]|uniref:Uncharacterized protein n=1 Tax=Rhodococcus sp. D-6 TaxID=1387842 RepID=A0AAU7UVZ9_9NOCA
MSLDTRVFGDPTSCYACADSLTALATGVNDRLKAARDGRTESEYEFRSPAGDAFRTTLDRIITGTTEAADQIDVIAAALRAFADGLVTVRSRMSQAEATAAEAGIPVEFGVGIGDPIDIDPNSYDIAPQVLRAKQIAAYETAAGLVANGRAVETGAHSALAEALRGPTTILKDAGAQWGGWFCTQSVGIWLRRFPSCRNGETWPRHAARTLLGCVSLPRKRRGWVIRTQKLLRPGLFGPSKGVRTMLHDSLRRTRDCLPGSVTTRSSDFLAAVSANISLKGPNWRISGRKFLSWVEF